MSTKTILILIGVALLAAACAVPPPPVAGLPVAAQASAESTPLKAAKLNIEHNATDEDTGFQGFVDSEGWQSLTITGPGGEALTLTGQGALSNLGLTELFFETVEPANADVPLAEMLALLPEGEYTIEGAAIESGESKGQTTGTAWLTHQIPAGPTLLSPEAEAVVSASDDLIVSWSPVTKTISGADVTTPPLLLQSR